MQYRGKSPSHLQHWDILCNFNKTKRNANKTRQLRIPGIPTTTSPGEEDVELPLPFIPIGQQIFQEREETRKEIPLPTEAVPAISETRGLAIKEGLIREIPLPEGNQDGVEVEIPLPSSEYDESNCHTPSQSHSRSGIPLPPSIDIPLPPNVYVRSLSIADDLSPVTPGELEIWDESLADIPLPNTPPRPQMLELGQVHSPTTIPFPIGVELPAPAITATTDEEAEVSSTMEIEEDPVTLRASPIRMPPPPPPPPMTPNDPINPNIPLGDESLPDEPQVLAAFDDAEELESPAFETFGETSPPRIDKVEEESFEDLIYNVSPVKQVPVAVSAPVPLDRVVEELKIKEKSRK